MRGQQEGTAYSVDHMIRYMPELAMTLTERYIQKITSMARRSQGPVCGMPYWQMLVAMIPMLSRQRLFRRSVLRGLGVSYETTCAYQSHAAPWSQAWPTRVGEG